MGELTILLLPGLDGDGFYCAAVKQALSAEQPCRMLAYPRELSDLADLCVWVCSELDTETDYILVGESFGGPLALLVAEALGDQCKGLVLCATFVSPPLPRPILYLASLLYSTFIPFNWMAHLLNFFVCNSRNLDTAKKLHKVLLATPADTIARRIRLLCSLDLRPEATSLEIPSLVLTATSDRLVWFGKFNHLLNNSTGLTLEGPHGLMGMRASECVKAISGFIKTKI